MTNFAIRNLSVLSYSQGFTSWHYRVHGPLADALVEGFFNPAADMMTQGDMVIVSGTDCGAHLFVRGKTINEIDIVVTARS